MGIGGSKTPTAGYSFENSAIQDQILGEKFFGLENFGNTCYCNATLQALYFCSPFRTKLLHYYLDHLQSFSTSSSPTYNDHPQKLKTSNPPSAKLIMSLGNLFAEIVQQKKKSGSLAPKKFIEDLRRDNETFRSYMQQDAHEFLNYLLNNIAETIQKELQTTPRSRPLSTSTPTSVSNAQDPEDSTTSMDITASSKTSVSRDINNSQMNGIDSQVMESTEEDIDDYSTNQEEEKEPSLISSKVQANDKIKTFVHEIFQGTLSTETRCNGCDNRSYRDESFLDLSIDVSQNSSVNYCIRNFSSTEILNGNNKFYCDSCHAYQEAQKSIKIKTCPPVLILHLKRFKYSEELQDFKKLNYRVTFPFKDLKIQTLLQQEIGYDLYAIVIHIGSGPNSGHYKCIIRSIAEDKWILFDDNNVEIIENDRVVRNLYGYPNDYAGVSETAYILFYKQNSSSG